MYNAEVLSKFPVVQHFPFGSLFSWDQDPNADAVETSVHTSSQPTNQTRQPQDGTRAPWATSSADATSMIAPRAVPTGMPATRAPWATSNAEQAPTRPSRTGLAGELPMRAPQADH